MELTKLQRVVVNALEDVKAHDIKVYNTVGLSDMFDRVVLASGTSNRQTRALAWHVAEKVKQAGGRVVSVEGADAGEWVLVDLGDVVVHIMQPTIRAYYGLEEVWGSKPVRVKLFDAKPQRAKELAAANGARGTAMKVTSKAAGKAVTKTAAKKTAQGKAPRPAAGTKAPPRKATSKTATSRLASLTKAALKKTAAKETAARNTPAKKTAAKKTALKKTALKKTASKKTAMKSAAGKETAAEKAPPKKAARNAAKKAAATRTAR
ncbi:MAG TPA: ribosome silencing factor [Burkholderiaceae bacterium]|nr:ribosome silencing factor [Burkholderiaceae bacterium]